MIVEITTMRATDDGAFREADERVQTAFFYQQPGFVRRTTAQSADGEWAVITVWGSEAHATAATDGFEHNEFWNAVDRASVRSQRYTTLD